jgi:nucleolar complex protein 2
MLAFVLCRARASAVFLGPFEKLQRKFLKAALSAFGGADAAARLQAMLFIRQLAICLPQPALDSCLKVRLCLRISRAAIGGLLGPRV